VSDTAFEFSPSPHGPTVERASPVTLRRLLSRFEGLSIELGVPVDEMNSGVERENLEQEFAAEGLSVSDEVAVWFGWRNGSGSAWGALPGMVAASFEQALHRRASLRVSMSSEIAWGVPDGWLHLADDNYGLAVDATGPTNGTSRLHFASPQFDEESVVGKMRANSLCTVVAWWIYGIETGGHSWDALERDWITDVSLLHPTQRDEHFF
jgi:hypothetical protein